MKKIETKVCSVCGEEKPLSGFYLSILKKTKPTSKCQCRECVHARQRASRHKYYWTHREQRLEGNKWSLIKGKFGLTQEDYNQKFAEQKGCCAICGVSQSELKFSLAVDHNHKTGQIRGLLCSTCNLGLGHFKTDYEDVILLKKAIAYFNSYKES